MNRRSFITLLGGAAGSQQRELPTHRQRFLRHNWKGSATSNTANESLPRQGFEVSPGTANFCSRRAADIQG